MQTTRRTFLAATAIAALGWSCRTERTLAGLAVADTGGDAASHLLVTIFLRGGLDGLSAVSPYAEDAYHRSRPTLGFSSPKAGLNAAGRAIDLDGFFGLHPSLAPILPLYRDGQLAIVHACGSGDQTLSHFDAMATMERGLARDSSTGASSGWLARHLNSAPATHSTPLRAAALGDVMPQSLAGATGASVFQSVDDLKISLPFGQQNDTVENAVRQSFAQFSGAPARQSGLQNLNVLKRLASLSPHAYRPANGAAYPTDDLGGALRQIAMLHKSNLGLEAACVDHQGYDTHVAQGGPQGILASRLSSLARALEAFRADLGGDYWPLTTVVVQSEFGRRVEENSGLGTDHGRGGVMMVLGGTGISGGRVYGKWPGLSADKLDPDGNLIVTTDYRNVLSEVLVKRCGNRDATSVFPGLSYQPLGLIHT